METNNPFRQVALILISLTIIVLGIVYNQVTSQSKAETTPSTKVSPGMSTNTSPQSTSPSTSTTPNPNIVVNPATPDFEQLNNSLALISELARISAISFAYSNLDIKLPGIGITTIPTTGGTTPAAPTLETNITPPAAPSSIAAPASSTNQVIPFLKTITGYSQWEQFKTNFREAEQKYAGTGKCMINVAGFGCLATW